MDKFKRFIFAICLLCTTVVVSLAREAEALREKISALRAISEVSPMRQITFLEKRYFPFRKRPVEMGGVLRIWEDRGVSIVYPEKGTGVVADGEGVLLRKFSKDGTFRQKNAGMGESDTFDLLKAAFEFDVDSLEEAFTIDWQLEDGKWSILLTPRSTEVQKIERLTISGRELQISKIEMIFAEQRRIEIYPAEEVSVEAFTEDEMRMYFRELAEE